MARLELARRQFDRQGEIFRKEFENQIGQAVLELKKASACVGSSSDMVLKNFISLK
jgi:hypothetical protein